VTGDVDDEDFCAAAAASRNCSTAGFRTRGYRRPSVSSRSSATWNCTWPPSIRRRTAAATACPSKPKRSPECWP